MLISIYFCVFFFLVVLFIDSLLLSLVVILGNELHFFKHYRSTPSSGACIAPEPSFFSWLFYFNQGTCTHMGMNSFYLLHRTRTVLNI